MIDKEEEIETTSIKEHKIISMEITWRISIQFSELHLLFIVYIEKIENTFCLLFFFT